jgi:hypothetical protein
MKLPKNESNTDRIIRIVIGIIALGLGIGWLTGVSQILAIGIGLVALITGVVGTCGLYMLCGTSTCPIRTK